MLAHILLNFLSMLRKRDKTGGLHFITFLCSKFYLIQYKSMNVTFYLSYDITITLKALFWYKLK